MKRRLIHAGLAWGAVALVYGWAHAQDAQQAFIHAFHKDCCPHNRCFPVNASPSIHFWSVEGFKSLVPLGQERYWHFKETYGCAYEHDPATIRCLFRPPPEAS